MRPSVKIFKQFFPSVAPPRLQPKGRLQALPANKRLRLTVINTNRLISTDTCGLYYKCFTIVTYDHNDSGQYHKTTITIVIDDPS